MKRIVILVDVKGWAWDIKAQQIQKHLSNEFDVTIRYFQGGFNNMKWSNEKYDAYFTFDPPSMRFIGKIPKEKKITGTTSHTYTNMKNYIDLIGHAEFLHANSKLLQKEIEILTKKKVYYLPNGVDESLFSFKERNIEDEFKVGYVGKDTERKGYKNYIVKACELAGVTLKSQVCRFNDKKKVIEHHKINEFYDDIDCIIVASDMDGTPNQLLEAASSGRTFVGNAIGNVPELVKDGVNGFLVEREVKPYVEKLKWLKDNREVCKQMGIEARKTIEQEWTWKIQAENYRQMFKDIVGE